MAVAAAAVDLEAAHAEVRRLRDAAEAQRDSEAATLQALRQEHGAKQAALSRSQVRTAQGCAHRRPPRAGKL